MDLVDQMKALSSKVFNIVLIDGKHIKLVKPSFV